MLSEDTPEMHFTCPGIDRLRPHINRVESGCWEWTAKLDRDGYGVVKIAGKSQGAHRVACAARWGPAPDMDASHLCNNRKCVNPNHLIWESHSANMERIERTACLKGHPYVQGSWQYTSRGNKKCRICVKEKYSKK